MAKKDKEPQYIMSALNSPMLNYQVYVMEKKEKLLTVMLAFIVGGIVGLTFYGGQFRDGNGDTTIATSICDSVIFIISGLVAIKIYIPMRIQQQLEKRRQELTYQFRSLLEALAVSLSSGMNMSESLFSALEDLKLQFSANAYIVCEVEEMISGIHNNIPIEKSMAFLGARSQIEDIANFSQVFAISYRAGGNLKDIVRRTNSIISEKIEIRGEIDTAISSNKSQFSAMMVLPIVMVLLLKTMSSDFAASFATVAGVTAVTVAIGIFILAYRLGQRIMDVKG